MNTCARAAVVSALFLLFLSATSASSGERARGSSQGEASDGNGAGLATVDGIVTSVNRVTGIVKVDTDHGALAVLAPAARALTFKPGDRVHLKMTLEAVLEHAAASSPGGPPDGRKATLAWFLLMLRHAYGSR